LRINEEIRAKEVRVNTDAGEQIGIMSLRDALLEAQNRQMDLVEIAPAAKPPVCRIMDYGKYRYEQQKRDKDVRKKQKIVSVKEVKLRPKIEEHDFQVKLKNALKFLAEGDKVKISVIFRGRELMHMDLGKRVLDRMTDLLRATAVIEREAKMEGRSMILIVAPKIVNK
jgi:translation initiation factor IF-3